MSPPPFEPPRTDLCTGNCQHRLLVLSGPIWLSHSSLQIRLRCCGCKTPVDSSGSPTDLPAKHAVALLSEVSLDYHESVPCTVESPGVLLLTMEYASIMFRPTILDDDQKRCWKIQVTHLHPTTLTPIPAIVPHYAYVPVADTNTRPVVERGASGSGVPRTTSGTSTQDLCRITSLPTNNPGPPPLFPYVLESLPSIGRAFPPHGSFTLPRIGTLPPMTAGVPSSQSFSSVLGLPDSYLPRETSSVVRLTTLGREESFNRLTRESSGSSVPRESSLPQTVNSDSTSTTSSSSVHRESTVPRDSTDYGFSFERRLGGSSLRPALPLPSSLSTSSLLPAPPSLSSTLAAIAPSSAPPRVPV